MTQNNRYSTSKNDSDVLEKIVEIVGRWRVDHNVKHMHSIADVVKEHIGLKIEEE